MRPDRSLAVTILIVLSLGPWCGPARSQQPAASTFPQPRLFTVTPPGGKAGTTVEVTLAGQDLDEPQALLFSSPDIRAELIPAPPPPAPDPKKPAPKAPAPPVLVRFKITIPGDIPLGFHDVRLVNKLGISNPRVFVVGDLDEVQEKEPNNDIGEAQRVPLNTTVNGVISAPADVDYFVFAGKKDQHVILSCLASGIDSRLHAGLELYDSSGKWLGFNRNYTEDDALLDCVLPGDGDYFARVFHFTYTEGSPEHFYRLSISTAPWIDAVFPPMVQPDRETTLTVFGRNLPQGHPDPLAVVDGRVLEKVTVTVKVPGDPGALQRLAYGGHLSPLASGLDGFEYRLHNDTGASNPFLLTYAQAPVVVDNEANDTPETAQEVALPCEIAGRIEKPHDRDWYNFKANKGDVYSIEVFGERLGSPADFYFTLRNAATKQPLGEFDDNPDTLAPFKFSTRTEDPPRYRFVVPADGAYQLMVTTRDADFRASPRQIYRVRITPERPDFRLVAMPAANNLPDANVVQQGGNQNFDVFVWRQDGWNGEITLTAEGLPAGVTCPPQVVGPGLKHGVLVISASPGAPSWFGEIRIKGSAAIDERAMVREARPASITWPVQQQNTVTVSRLDRGLFLAVGGKALFRLDAALDKTSIVQGEKANLSLKLARLDPDFKSPLLVLPLGVPPALALPANVTVNNNQPLTMPPDKNEATVVLDAKPNAVPGTYTIALRGQGQLGAAKDGAAKQKGNTVVVQPSTPVTLTILPKQLATIALASPNPTVKIGTQTDVVVKIVRMYDFTGEFKVHVVMPPAAKGVSAEDVVIPAGRDEVRLVFRAAADATPGNRSELMVRATALFHGTAPTTQEAKISVNVVK